MRDGPGGDKSFAYICTNGTVADGTTGTENTEKCSACDAGFELSLVKQCVVPGDVTAPAVVTDLTATLPSPSVGTVQLDWIEPADADFSHVLISWTPDTPDAPIQVNKRTTTTVIPASGLTSGTAYTFTAISVDATGNMSADSSGATATPVLVVCPAVLFATTTGGPYAPQANVASGSDTEADPYVIPLVAGVLTTCPITIDFDYSAVTIANSIEFFRITNMPAGASYTSTTLAWAYKDMTPDVNAIVFRLAENPVSFNKNKGRMTCGAANDESCAMNTVTDDTVVMPTSARTIGFRLDNASLLDSFTLTLTP